MGAGEGPLNTGRENEDAISQIFGKGENTKVEESPYGKQFLEALGVLMSNLLLVTPENAHPRNRLYNRGRLPSQYKLKSEDKVCLSEEISTSTHKNELVPEPQSKKATSKIFSTLSHEAPEFVPKGCNSASSTSTLPHNPLASKSAVVVPQLKVHVESPTQTMTEVNPIFDVATCNYVIAYGHLPPNFDPALNPPESIKTAQEMFLHHDAQVILQRQLESQQSSREVKVPINNSPPPPPPPGANGISPSPMAPFYPNPFQYNLLISPHRRPFNQITPMAVATSVSPLGHVHFHGIPQARSVSQYQQQFSPIKSRPVGGPYSNNSTSPSYSSSKICIYCKSIGQPRDMYNSHSTRNPSNGKAVCPLLRKLKCDKCGATGDKAHSDNECPFNLIPKRKVETSTNPEISRKLSFTSSIEKIGDHLKNSARFI